MTEIQEVRTADTFGRELRSFFVLCLMNLVFGALVMAFGLQFMVTAVLAMTGPVRPGIFPFLQLVAGGAAAVIGFRWILLSAGILKGVNRIRREYRALEGSRATGDLHGDEPVTGLIIRMMAHYRENRETILRMTFISALGGCIFVALGVMNLVQGIAALAAGGRAIFPFLAGGLNLAIGLVSLLSSSGFRRYSRAWEGRLAEAARSEEALQKALEKA